MNEDEVAQLLNVRLLKIREALRHSRELVTSCPTRSVGIWNSGGG